MLHISCVTGICEQAADEESFELPQKEEGTQIQRKPGGESQEMLLQTKFFPPSGSTKIVMDDKSYFGLRLQVIVATTLQVMPLCQIQ